MENLSADPLAMRTISKEWGKKPPDDFTLKF